MNHIPSKKYIRFTILLFCGILLCCPFLLGCRKNITPVTVNGFYFNTVISLTFYETDTEKLKQLENSCNRLMQDYEAMFSRTVEGSDVWNINHANCKPVTVSDETVFLLQKAIDYAVLSEGLVDPTIGSLSALWNFGDTNEKKIPSKEEISKALSHVNYENIIIDGNQVTLNDPDAVIDLGFIAKGYIADLLKEYLLTQDVNHAIINLGGNVLAIGTKPDGSNYKVGIQKPFAQTGTALMTVPISDCSLVSSGNYERYFTQNDTLYHHILSTQDGYPADSDLSQVSIITPSSVDGDALSTLCFILGYEKGRELIGSLPDTEAVFVLANGEIKKTF